MKTMCSPSYHHNVFHNSCTWAHDVRYWYLHWYNEKIPRALASINMDVESITWARMVSTDFESIFD